ncbi:MAG TPA: DASS family sodium-coupled anion symporter [Tepidisphaeraceae bacterium]|nr:DASS family sodium-coupled anion symporter [Tepidisphaeraceae bacterium]
MSRDSITEYQSEGTVSPAEEKFEQYRKLAGVILAPIAFAVVFWLCPGLTPEGRKLAAILAAVGVLWVTEVIPLPVTALLGAILCIMLGVADAKKVFAYFADPIVFVFIGGFMLAQAMSVHGLDRRIALSFLSLPRVGGSTIGIIGGIGLVTALLSMWVSNTATTAMMLPIGLGILSALHRVRVASGAASGAMNARAWPAATAMMLMIAYSASIGGIGTPVGSPPNLIGIAMIRNATKVEISFFQWMSLCFPLLLLMGAALFVVLMATHRDPGARKLDGAEMMKFIRGERQRLGPWSAGQRNALIAFLVAVTLWILPGILALPWFSHLPAGKWMSKFMPEAVVAIAATVLLFMLPIRLSKAEFTLNWQQAARIDWGTILLFGGGLALGSLMFDTGVAKAMGEGLTAKIGASSLWMLTGVSILLAIILSEATSNTASANMVIPVVIAIAQSAGVDPLPPALGACLGASYGFMLPVSTPPNAIVYGSGLVPIGRMMRAGILFDIIGFFIIWGGLRVMWPIIF